MTFQDTFKMRKFYRGANRVIPACCL